MTTMTVSEARAALPRLLDTVHDGEEVVITRHGKPAAVLIRPDLLRTRASGALKAAQAVRELLQDYEPAQHRGGQRLTADRADELIKEIRSGRDSR